MLVESTQQNRNEINELRQELRELSGVVQKIVYELQRQKDNEAHEREKLFLKLENELLRFERRLPAALQRGDQQKGEE